MGAGATLVVVVIVGIIIWAICRCRRKSKIESKDVLVTPTGTTLAAFDLDKKGGTKGEYATKRSVTNITDQETKPPNSVDDNEKNGRRPGAPLIIQLENPQ